MRHERVSCKVLPEVDSGRCVDWYATEYSQDTFEGISLWLQVQLTCVPSDACRCETRVQEY